MKRQRLSFLIRQETIKQSPEYLQSFLSDCCQITRQNTHLNAFIHTDFQSAERHAGEIVNAIRKGQNFALAGSAVAVKDNIAVKGMPLTCASRLLEGYTSPYSATAVERLQAAGAIVIGKTNLDEFAMGSSTEASIFGSAVNPYDNARVAGGSSGGSAAAVAAGLASVALGSDTGGSVRQPASFCGVTGFKPAYGRVSRYGLVAFGSSLDQIGVLSRDVDEIARVMSVIAGADALDSTSLRTDPPEYLEYRNLSLKGVRIGVPVELNRSAIQPAVKKQFQEFLKECQSFGMEVIPCALPHSEYAIAVYQIISSAECSSNLARFDGIRYGNRASGADFEESIRNTRQEFLGAEVKRRIMMGTFVLSEGYLDQYYLKSQKLRRLIYEDFTKTLQNVDLIATPTTPETAFLLGEKLNDPLAMYQSDKFTVLANLAGVPAVSLPFGTDDDGLPIGMQLMCRAPDEPLLLKMCRELARMPKLGCDGVVADGR